MGWARCVSIAGPGRRVPKNKRPRRYPGGASKMDLSLNSARRHLQRPPGRRFHGLALERDKIHGRKLLDLRAKSNGYPKPFGGLPLPGKAATVLPGSPRQVALL